MWNEPTKERLARIPKLYGTEEIPVRGKEIYLHFFLGGSDWFISETDGEDIMFGFCILNNDYEMAEWGYVSLSELRSIKIEGWLEVDCELEAHWKVRTAKEVEQIRKACGWMIEEELKMKIEAEKFKTFRDSILEVIRPHSDFSDVDPYPIWEVQNEQHRN